MKVILNDKEHQDGFMGMANGEEYKVIYDGGTYWTILNNRSEELNIPKECFK